MADNARAGAMGSNLRAGPGLLWRYGAQGPTLCTMRRPIQRASTTVPRPLECYIAQVSGDSLKLQVRPGTILNEMPTIGGGALDDDPPPYLVLSKTATKFVVFNITMTYSIVDGKFTTPTMGSVGVTITLEDAAPGSSNARSTSGNFKFLLAKYIDGEKTMQNGYGPIGGELCDTLQGTHNAQLLLKYPGA